MHEAHHMMLMEEALGQNTVLEYEGYLRRHSVQVSVAHVNTSCSVVLVQATVKAV